MVKRGRQQVDIDFPLNAAKKKIYYLHQSTAVSTWWCGPDPVWVGSKWLLDFPRVPVTPRTPLYFLLCCSLIDRRRAAHSFLKIGCLFSFSLFSCLSPACFRLLIFLLLLMSGNVQPNPGPIFPCSVGAVNVTWPGKSVQCCTCYKSIHLRCSRLSLSDLLYPSLSLSF